MDNKEIIYTTVEASLEKLEMGTVSGESTSSSDKTDRLIIDEDEENAACSIEKPMEAYQIFNDGANMKEKKMIEAAGDEEPKPKKDEDPGEGKSTSGGKRAGPDQSMNRKRDDYYDPGEGTSTGGGKRARPDQPMNRKPHDYYDPGEGTSAGGGKRAYRLLPWKPHHEQRQMSRRRLERSRRIYAHYLNTLADAQNDPDPKDS